MNAPAAIRAVVADDHAIVRIGTRVRLEMIEGVRVVAEAGSGIELLHAVQREQPDLVVTDIRMPDMDGLTAVRALREQGLPRLRVLVMSMHDTPDVIRRAIQAGADAYVRKGGDAGELEAAVRHVMRGEPYVSPRPAGRSLVHAEPIAENVLTERQLEILKLIARGHASKEIAFQLGLSSKTVDVHRAHIMERLRIADIASLTLYCVRQGLVDPSADG